MGEPIQIKPSKVQISMCSSSGPAHETFCSILAMWKHGFLTTPHDYTFRYAMRTFIHTARKQLAEQAIAEKRDYIIWLDDDMVWPPDTFHRLVAVAQVYNLDIVGGYYTTRKKIPYPLIYSWNEADQGFKPKLPKAHVRNDLIEVDATGLGCCLMKTSVFERVEKPWFEVLDGWSEDTYFFRKCTKAGIKIYVDVGLPCGHQGQPSWNFPYETPITKHLSGPIVYAEKALREAKEIVLGDDLKNNSESKEVCNACQSDSNTGKACACEDGGKEDRKESRKEAGVSDVRLERGCWCPYNDNRPSNN